MSKEKPKYQLSYYWDHGICDQCGNSILTLDEELSYTGDSCQKLQLFLDEKEKYWNFQSSDACHQFEINGGYRRQKVKSDYMSPYRVTEFVGSKIIHGQFCCTECRDKWREERRAEDMKIAAFFQELQEYARKIDPEPCDNPSGVIVFDLETTGLNSRDNEILQISALDGNGNILINEYVRPELIKSWPDAERVNGITPEKVANCKTIRDLIGKIKGVFASGKTWIAYNADFDLSFLYYIDIVPDSDTNLEDVMYEFAEIYGDFNKITGTCKWQTLKTAAEYYGYEYQAHDSLEDVRTTLYVRNKIKQAIKEKELLTDAILSNC